MSTSFRIATFNVENLLWRAKLLNFAEKEKGDVLLGQLAELQAELRKAAYDKPKIVKLFQPLRDYIEVIEVRGKLFNSSKNKVLVDGAAQWAGFIRLKRDTFSEETRANTARVIRAVSADILCLVEVEDRPTLQHFCSERLKKAAAFAPYPHQMLIDGNDDARGIDVGLASRFPIGPLHSHVDDRDKTGLIFSRDCLEVKVLHPAGMTITLLLNHFKSQGYGTPAANDAKRLRQTARVAEILQGYDLQQDCVVVAGDFNHNPDGPSLGPLLALPHLHDVLAWAFPNDPARRWTYAYQKKCDQLDYLLVSEPLCAALQAVGVERRGIFNLKALTAGAETSFDTVTSYTNCASDHGALWADFKM